MPRLVAAQFGGAVMDGTDKEAAAGHSFISLQSNS
jgi:hypothetical protein